MNPKTTQPIPYQALDANARARLADERTLALEAGLNFDFKYFVRATGLGNWPGAQPFDAIHRVRGELGAPHLSYLPALPHRSYTATTLARTIATFQELGVDGASFGWRLHEGYSAEQDAAASTFDSDINALADVIAGKKNTSDILKLQFIGPVTLAAELHLHNGERSLRDRGARRDIRDSFIAGLDSRIAQVKEAAPGVNIYLQFDEPQLKRALQGSIPTASGYRYYEPLDTHEIIETYFVLTDALRLTGIKSTLNIGTQSLDPKLFTEFDALAYAHPGMDAYAWEPTAGAVERGQEIWLATVDVTERQSVRTIVDGILRPWRQVGLPTTGLSQLTLTEKGDITQLTSGAATAVLAHTTESAAALAEAAQETD